MMKSDIEKVHWSLIDLLEDSVIAQDKEWWDFARNTIDTMMEMLKKNDEYHVLRI